MVVGNHSQLHVGGHRDVCDSIGLQPGTRKDKDS